MAATRLPADAVTLAAAHRARQQTIAGLANAQTSRLWQFLRSLGWAAIGPRMTGVVQAAMREAGRGAQDYAAAAARAAGAEPDPAGRVAEATFAATASDGRPLASLLEQPSLEVAAFVDRGMPAAQADAIGRRHLQRIVTTQVGDAARVATGVAVVNDRALKGYVRHLTLPSCQRCIILAGQFYRWSDGFQRHPQCFPAGTLVAGPQTSAATRRLYEGELVVLTTASGQQLALTGNHPVLTRHGWVPAHFLNEGDEVVRSTRADGPTALVVPNQNQMPALVEDVWSSLGVVRSLGRGSTDDFHGDGQHGQVDVVYADGALNDGPHFHLGQQVPQLVLARRAGSAEMLIEQRAPVLVDLGYPSHAGDAIRGGGLGFPVFGPHLLGADPPGFAWLATLDSGAGEAAAYDAATHAVLAAERVFAGARQIGAHDLVDGEGALSTRWDAPGGPLTVENRGAYASRGADLLQRLAGQVEPDRLVEVRRVEWSGHVYSLTSVEGWHSANSLIVSNCDCVHVPAPEAVDPPSPREVYDSLSDEERRKAGWSGHDQRAIDDGADLNRVTNARLSLESVTIAGHRLKTSNVGFKRQRVKVRLTPEAIYHEAERLGWNRDETIRQLKRHGYIL